MTNEEKLAYCRIDQWHAAGYRGRGVKIAISDLAEAEYNPNWFPDANIIVAESEQYRINKNAKYNHLSHQLLSILLAAPDSEIHVVDGSGTPKLQYLIDNDIDVYSHSTTITWYNDMNNAQENVIIGMDNVLMTAAGNVSDGGFIVLGNKDTWLSVGACAYMSGGIYRQSYSCYNKLNPRVTGVFFSNFTYPDGTHTGEGTSFSVPAYAATYALWRGQFKERNGRKPTLEETRSFLRDNSEAVYDENPYSTGYGLLRLPEVNAKVETEYDVLTVTVGSTVADLNGEPYTLVAAPILYGGRTMVSLKDAVEAFGGNVVSWDNVTKTAVLRMPKRQRGDNGL